MIKIGILGTDNSHAGDFSKLANERDYQGRYLFEDVRVTHVYGHDEKETKTLAETYHIENIVKNPLEMLDEVDAVMVVFRDGKWHYQYAEPFVRKGIPVWIDKPITINPEETLRLIEIAKTSGCLLSGGSDCKLASDIASIKEYIKSRKYPIASAMMNFSIQLNSIYSGMFFYASHCIEMTTEIFGFDVKSVFAHVNNTSVNAIFEYENYDVHLGFLPAAAKYSCYLLERFHNTKIDIEINDIAENGLKEFIETIKTKKMKYPMENLYKTVALINAVNDSMNSGKIVKVEYKM